MSDIPLDASKSKPSDTTTTNSPVTGSSSTKSALFTRLSTTLSQRRASNGLRKLTLTPSNSIDFSSNDFLSLSTSPALRDAFVNELALASAEPLGSGGSRLLDGNSAYAERIEHDLAAFHGAPAGLLFNSGFDANSGLFSCLPARADVVVFDQFIHASVHEGMRLSRAAARLAFAHNSLQDLRRVLLEVRREHPATASGKASVFVAVESVYSMDGDVAPLREILDLMDAVFSHGNAHLIVDEAHSTGVYGARGRGVVSMLGLESRVLARLHTFGKALSSGGAILLCAPLLREYLINYARSLVYTTAMGLPTLALIKAVYVLLRSGQTESTLQSTIQQAPQPADILTLPAVDEPPKSPIFSLLTPLPRDLAAACQRAGLVVRAIVPPTVPDGGERVRVCLHAGNTEAEIDALVECIRLWALERAQQEPVRFHDAKRARL